MPETITISDALRRIKAIKGDIARWSALFANSNVWIEDQPRPAYASGEIEKNLQALTNQLVKLKTALAIANASTYITFSSAEEAQSRFSSKQQMSLVEVNCLLSENKSRQTVYAALVTLSEPESTIRRAAYAPTGQVTQVEVKQHSPVTTRVKDQALKNLRDEFAYLNSLLERANNTNTIEV